MPWTPVNAIPTQYAVGRAGSGVGATFPGILAATRANLRVLAQPKEVDTVADGQQRSQRTEIPAPGAGHD